MLTEALQRIANDRGSLTREEAREVMTEVFSGSATDAQIAANPDCQRQVLMAASGRDLQNDRPAPKRRLRGHEDPSLAAAAQLRSGTWRSTKGRAETV